jgi:hypothetical protein
VRLVLPSLVRVACGVVSVGLGEAAGDAGKAAKCQLQSLAKLRYLCASTIMILDLNLYKITVKKITDAPSTPAYCRIEKTNLRNHFSIEK